jgi:hypothetical protein
VLIVAPCDMGRRAFAAANRCAIRRVGFIAGGTPAARVKVVVLPAAVKVLLQMTGRRSKHRRAEAQRAGQRRTRAVSDELPEMSGTVSEVAWPLRCRRRGVVEQEVQ